MGIFGFLAGPLGWLLRLVYSLVNDYFLAIFLFTLITRLLMFPLSLQQQKKQSDRIRLAPRLERLQKKYKQYTRKLQQKQQALYEKEGVSMTGGCLPMIVQMIVLFGIIAVIYEP
ncbi:MAG: membrane protein insertase YidC, partial [Clostridia bacterium]|nr:membrane protein insertase YidC [Clostridia bacterium]